MRNIKKYKRASGGLIINILEEMERLKIRKALFSSLVLTLFLAGCAGKTATETEQDTSSKEEVSTNTQEKALTPVNVGYLPSTGHSLYFIAEGEGYFEEAGLDVSFSLFSNSGEGINAVAAGQLDVGTFGTAAPLKFEEQGAEFVIFGGQMGEGAGIVAKPENAEGLKDPANFEGKKVATVSLATGDVVWRSAVHDAGLDLENDLEIVEMQSANDVIVAVNQGEVDAGVVWVPYVEKAKQEGLEIVAYTNEYMEDHVCGRIIANTDKFKEEPETYIAFMEAMIKAERFLADENNKDAVLADVAAFIDVDKEIIEKDLYDGYLVQSADPDKNAILAFREKMVEIGYLAEDKDVSGIIDIEVYKSALENLKAENPEDPFYQELEERYVEKNL